MSKTSTRLLIGFVAGFLSHVIFEGALGAILYATHVVPTLPWSFEPVMPLGVPQTISLGFWAGLFGVAYALLEPRLTAVLGRRPGGLIFGLALPLLVDWFVVLPLKGAGIGGGFHLGVVPIDVALNAVLGIGTVLIFWLGLALVERLSPVSPRAPASLGHQGRRQPIARHTTRKV